MGRGANPVSYLIHTSILAPYPQLTKGLVKVTLAAPANGSGSNKNTTNALDQCSGSAAALTTQLPLKEYDSQIVSSLLSFLYTDEYWPSVEQIIGSSAVQKGVIIEETTGNQLLFTSQALTTHHFKLALLSSKYSIDGLIGIARQKMALTLQDLPPKELLEVIRVIYSKGYSFREKFFEFLSIESVEDENRKSGKCFWSRELLGKLMSNDQEMDYGSDGDGLQSVMDIRNQFLAMVQEGGDLARDALTASWKLGFSSLEPRLSLNSEAV